MSVELKIKSKHLGEEARIIRFEEKKLLRQMRWAKRNKAIKEAENFSYKFFSLNSHRRHDVRNENRATFLARAFLKGVPYKTVEHTRKEENEYNFQTHVLPRVKTLVAKYGSHNLKQLADSLVVEWIAV